MNMGRSIVAVFDFDHTLTDRDTLLPFLFFSQGALKTAYKLSKMSISFLAYLYGRISRQEIKEKVLTRFFCGDFFFDFQKLAKEFSEKRLDLYLKDEALRRLEWHLGEGHRCVLVSASLEVYLRPWAKRHGFEAVLGTKLEIDSGRKVTGKLEGANCWGLEKKKRLVKYLGELTEYEIYVYGDSEGDREILEIANHPYYRSFDRERSWCK